MSYVKQHDICVFTSYQHSFVKAVRCTDGATLWELSDAVLGLKIEPVGVTCDDSGRIYVANVPEIRVLTINSLNGDLLQELKLEGVEVFIDIQWANSQLIVLHDDLLHDRKRKISLYKVMRKI